MREPRPEKVAIVAEVRDRITASEAVIFTEYRGLKVGDLAELRHALRVAGGEYTIYKNRLVRVAAENLGLDLSEFLTGPTAIAFVSPDGDAAAVAKVLRDFSQRDDESLSIKGGVLNRTVIETEGIHMMADLPSREVLLAQLVGTFAAPLTNMARLLQAVPRKFAYALSALIDKQDDGSD